MKQFVFPCVIRIHLKILWIPGRPMLQPSTTLHENWACSFSVQTEFQVIQVKLLYLSDHTSKRHHPLSQFLSAHIPTGTKGFIKESLSSAGMLISEFHNLLLEGGFLD